MVPGSLAGGDGDGLVVEPDADVVAVELLLLCRGEVRGFLAADAGGGGGGAGPGEEG